MYVNAFSQLYYDQATVAQITSTVARICELPWSTVPVPYVHGVPEVQCGFEKCYMLRYIGSSI